MRPVFQAIGKIAPTNKLVLLRGETGVGKELIAKAIHDMSGRRGEYVPMNIAAIDKMLFTDALFGHVKGAFDGAKEKRNGFIAKAQDGTLFMDEIGDMDCESQTSLLRILKDGTYYKVGSEEIIKSNTRIIAATNINIEQKIACGNYREDFFQQLKSFIINIPPLRERKEDIPLLIEYFIEKAVDNFQKNKIVPDREFIKKLSTYDLKGNVRELKHLIEELILKFQGCERLTVKMLDEISKNKELYSISLDSPFSIITEVNRKIGEGNYPSFMEIEAGYLKEVLLKSGSNYAQAAKFAGLSQRTFIYRLQTIKKKLNVMGLDFETFPKLSELIKRFH